MLKMRLRPLCLLRYLLLVRSPRLCCFMNFLHSRRLLDYHHQIHISLTSTRQCTLPALLKDFFSSRLLLQNPNHNPNLNPNLHTWLTSRQQCTLLALQVHPFLRLLRR